MLLHRKNAKTPSETSEELGVFKKSVSWSSTFVTTVLQENERRSDVTFLAHTFWTHPTVYLNLP